MSKRVLKSFAKSTPVYLCVGCRAHHPDKVQMCRSCHGHDIIYFASKAEAARYHELKLLERAGEITDLECQKRFSLHAHNGTIPVKIAEYRCDFYYFDKKLGHHIVEDVKGRNSPISEISAHKIKHAEAEHKIKVELVRR